MKQSCRDMDVYEFKEEDELTDTYPQWSKISNPNNSTTKNQFPCDGSAVSIKEVQQFHVMEIDDGGHGFISDASVNHLDLLKNASSIQSLSLGAIPDGALQQYVDNINPESSSQGMEMSDPNPFGSSPANGHTCPIIPKSPSSDGSIDNETPDPDDSIQEGFPPTPTSPSEENLVLRNGQARDQSVSGFEMEELDTIVLHTDYVLYRNKYFPASIILISKDSVKAEALALEEEAKPFRLEWEIDDIVLIEPQWSSVAHTAKVKFHLLTKDGMQAEKNNDASGVEVLEFLVHDPNWSHRQEGIMLLDMKLNALWSGQINDKNCGGDSFHTDNRECSSDPYIPSFEEPFEEVVYPEGDVDAVSISKRDFDLLQPETFVNDTIIDFYMKYLKNEIPLQESHRFHFFNSFFFRKLADLDKNPSSAFDGKAAFQRVRKWTRKVNIFEKDYIFIPVNYNLHWSLLVICHPGEIRNFNDENVDGSLKVPCILHMDSIRGSHMGLKDLVQSYLLEEWKERQKGTSEDISSKFLNLRFLSLELPQQENCSDCGLFLLHYAELFIAEVPGNFNPFQINNFDTFLKPDWFVPAEASLKRVHIQRLIYELLESRSRGTALPSCSNEGHHSTVQRNNDHYHGIEILSEKNNPEAFSNRNVLCTQSVQGLEMDLLDVSLYRTSPCINDPGMGMTELLQQCQTFDQSASLVQLRFPMSPVREEVEDDEHLADSSLGQGGVDNCGVFDWNSELSDHAEPEEDSSPVSNCPSDDSEEMAIIEFNAVNQGKEDQTQSQNLEASRENMDSLTESYASASSDMMETPAEDSQELDEIYWANDQENLPPSSNPVDMLQPIPQEIDREENGAVACLDEKLVVEDSSSDSGDNRNAKRMRLTPSLDGETTLVTTLLSETVCSKDNNTISSPIKRSPA